MHLQRLHVPIISIDAPHAAQLESDRTRNIETLQKSFLTKGKHTHAHTLPGCSCSVSNAQRIWLVFYLAKKLKSQTQKSRQILFTLLCTLRIRAVGSSEKKDNTLKALVWRKIVNFPPVNMCILQICINPGRMFALSLSRCRRRGRFAYCQLCSLIYMHEILW